MSFDVFDRELAIVLREFTIVLVAVLGDGTVIFGMDGTGTDPLVKKASIEYIINRIIAPIIIAGA
jgi:hypothetical protein